MTLIKPDPVVSVWQTVEVYCLSRDFDYKQYSETVERMSHIKALPVSRLMYAALGRAFHDEMTLDYE